ncbi:penicillin acylase family protein [Candidatus Acetothermia bacterium]|nr:penicillin acylase family protein [Candidatus Acetothermia bacterium]
MLALRLIAIVVIISIISGVYIFVERPAPEIRGPLRLNGLTDKVEVIRDPWGVPHLYAQNEEDLFFAQGYVTAQDRLWQMDLTRRAGAGRLSEILGRVALNADKTVRTLGFARHAKAAAQKLSSSSRKLAEAYARGVNEFINTHLDRLPLEFTVLGYRPEPWAVEDIFLILATMAQALQLNMNDMVWRTRAQKILSEEKFKELNEPYSIDGTFVLEANGQGRIAPDSSSIPTISKYSLREKTLESLEKFALDYTSMIGLSPEDWEGIGSNNWVVDGSLTATKKPYLANDPHLNVRQPATWYEIHLSAPGWNVMGASLPGIPGIEIGHNDKISWGVTVVGLAVQDLFIEKFNPNNPQQYEYQSQWRDAQTFEEAIRVKGEKAPLIHKVLVTRHGPIVTELFPEETERIALSWALFSNESSAAEGLDGLLALDQAQNWGEFRKAVSLWGFDLNFVYSDVEGNIGYQMSGKFPKRLKGYQGISVPGESGEYEWEGFIPFSQLPYTFNPPTHFIATANHRVVSPAYPIEIPGEWATPYRERRAVHLLQAKGNFTLEEMRAMQADSYSEAYDKLAKLLVEHLRTQSVTRGERQILDFLSAWNGATKETSVETSIIHETFEELVDYAFKSKLGKASNFVDYRKGTYLFLKFAKSNAASNWFDDPATPKKEQLDEALLLGFRQALENLTKSHGADFHQWEWGKLFPKKFRHAFSNIPVLGELFDRVAPNSGGPLTLNRADPNGPVTSYREIIDLSNLDNSRSGITTGESGNPFSNFYSDQLQAWRAVQPHPMLWEKASVQKYKKAVLNLLPKNP